jgi:hypothetical protein
MGSGIIAIDFNQRQSDLRVGAYLMTTAVFYQFWFLAMLRNRLEQAQGESGWLPFVAYGAGLTCTAILLLLARLGFAASLIGNYEGDWQVAKTILLIGCDLNPLLGRRGLRCGCPGPRMRGNIRSLCHSEPLTSPGSTAMRS